MQLAQGLSQAGGTWWREKRKGYRIAADGEALRLEGRRGVWPGLEPSPPSSPVSLRDSPRGLYPCTSPDGAASPSQASTGINIYFAVTHTPESGLDLCQEKRNLGLQGEGQLEYTQAEVRHTHTPATQWA